MFSRPVFATVMVSLLAGGIAFAQARRTDKGIHGPSQNLTSGVCGAPKTVESSRSTVFNEHLGNYWLQEDVRFIIPDPERAAYKTLRSDEERTNFIEAFWRRRDPTPDTIENEFKDEHYRRIVYANERFSSRLPGWKTDRGRMYIMYGPPDSVESTTLGALKEKGNENFDELSAAPVEVWHYRYIEGIGQDVTFQFVDVCDCGDFRMRIPAESDSVKPNMGRDSLTPPPDLRQLHDEPEPTPATVSSELVKPPQVRFKELEEVVTSKVRYNSVPFEVQTSAVRATQSTAWVALTLQVKKGDLRWEENDGRAWANLHVFARFLTMTGRVAATIEEEIKKSDERKGAAANAANGSLQFSRPLALPAGRYRLDIAVQDVPADKIGTWAGGIIVPGFYADELATSLMLASHIDIPVLHYAYPISGELYIGDTRIKPSLAQSSGAPAVFHTGEELAVFHTGEELWLFLQAYNLSVNSGNGKSDAAIAYKLVNATNGNIAIDLQETNPELRRSAEQITVHRSIPLVDVPKGEYHMCVTVNDRIARRSSMSTARVLIE